MSNILWPLVLFADEVHKIDTLLFGTLEDDCHGTIMLKVLIIVVNFLLAGVLVGGTVGIIWSGVQILAARENASMVANGKKRIIDVLIGITAFVFMYVILDFIIPGGVTLESSALNSNGEACPEVVPLAPAEQTGSPQQGEENPPSGTGDIEHGIRSFTMCNMEFNVIKIQVNGVKDDGTDSTGLKKYLTDKVQKYHINQSDGKVYNLTGSYSNSNSQDGHCDAVSRNLAYDMYFDALTADNCSAGGRDPRKSGFSAVTGDSGFKKAYDDIMAGKPVVHRVTINTNGQNAQPHYAVLVGVKKSASRESLTNSDFLFVETWGDGILWNNIPKVPGGYRTNAGGSGCIHVNEKNRFPYDTYYYVPNTTVGDSKMDCG